jgi:hypothetical protein
LTTQLTHLNQVIEDYQRATLSVEETLKNVLAGGAPQHQVVDAIAALRKHANRSTQQRSQTLPLKFRSQARIPGVKRRRYSTAVLNQIEAAIEREVARYAVSRSFVIANALAYAFGIRWRTTCQKRRSRSVGQEADARPRSGDLSMKTLWMSFIDTDQPMGARFLGVCIVDVSPEDEALALAEHPEMYDKVNGPSVVAAAKIAYARGCNPGGEVQALEIQEPVPDEHKYKLMGKAELIAAGFIEGKKESVN